ncbi:MAG TPA: hypothetical protein VFT99_21370, partial [Roseiflexaceae bacterium]|nr:hypothetical protein [Roseiflexaceae bacterium]
MLDIQPAPPALDDATLQQHIGWLRSLTPASAVPAICDAILAGTPEDELWAAGALAATRYINNQGHNLLGFVSHAMLGCEDARALAQSQPPHVRRLLLMQALHQVVCDMHDPSFAPYELLPFWPVQEAGVTASIERLRADVRFGEYSRSDHRFVGLAGLLARDQLVDLLLEIGLEGMCSDDHTLISPVLCLGMIDLVGWERGFDMLRWSVRYSASFARNFGPYERAVALLGEYGLHNGPQAAGLQPERVAALRAELFGAPPSERPVRAAQALAAGTAPETVIAAAALVCCDMYLMTVPVPHADYDAVSREVAPIHLGTTFDSLRVGLARMQPRTRALAAIMAGSLLERGPSVLDQTFTFVPFTPAKPYPYPEDVEALRGIHPRELCSLLRTAAFAHDYRSATAAVAAYAASGADAEPLIEQLIAIACTDNGTLMHNFKHLHAMVSGFRSC